MQSGVRTLQAAGNDATDDRGIYRIYGLQLGDYLICATPRPALPAGAPPALDRLQEVVAAMATQPGATGQVATTVLADRIGAAAAAQAEAAQDEPTTGYAPVYFPGTTMTNNATSVPLNVGEERLGVDFQLQLVAMARVEGMVIYPSGQEPGGLQIQLVNVGDDVGGIGGNSARVDRDGKFRFSNVAPGQYTLVARTGGPGANDGPRHGDRWPDADAPAVRARTSPVKAEVPAAESRRRVCGRAPISRWTAAICRTSCSRCSPRSRWRAAWSSTAPPRRCRPT